MDSTLLHRWTEVMATAQTAPAVLTLCKFVNRCSCHCAPYEGICGEGECSGTLTPARDRCEWLPSLPDRFIPEIEPILLVTLEAVWAQQPV
jgi:hypothetical protein